MSYKNMLPSLSSIALALALVQPLAAEEATPAAGAAPEAPAAAATPAPAAAAPVPVAEPPAAPPVAELPPPVPPMMEAPQSPTLPDEMAKRQADYAQQAAERQAAHEKRMAERKAHWERMRAMTPEERWKARRAELSARYQELRRRADESGMELPETAPWEAGMSGPIGTEEHPWGQEQMSPNGPPTSEGHPDWEKLQAVINGMTPEEREACTTVHRLSMGTPMPPVLPPPERGYDPNYGPAPGYGMAPGYGSGGYGAGPGYSGGPGYGYGPGYGNAPGYGYYGRGMGNAPDWQSWQGYSR